MDPGLGRFTDIEFETLLETARFAYTAGIVSLDQYVLLLLFIAIGARPIQYAAMKTMDLKVLESVGAPTYVLSVPRAKQREEMARSSFRKRILTPEIGELLHQHVRSVETQFVGLLPDVSQAPMFPAVRREACEPPGFEYHRTNMSLQGWFRSTIGQLDVVSERTGKSMSLSPIRFRRTLACRAADEGHGEFVIADLLDQSDTQNTGVYTEVTSGMLERIDKAVALKLAPLAQAFAGMLIQDESQATRAGDVTSRIADPKLAPHKPMGNCGKFGFCGLLAPVACYTCCSFEPWLDGPHERVLDFLIAERERLQSGTDTRVAAITDRTILAVAEVVRRCSIARSSKEQSNV